MAEQFLTLMAEFDDQTQARLSQWYKSIKSAGVIGTQTAGLPYHISMATLPLEKEAEAAALTRKLAAEFSSFPVYVSHIGMLAGGRVLFCSPERDAILNALREACKANCCSQFPWTPHVTMLIDEPDRVQSVLPELVREFTPFVGTIVRLRLCAFWPTREIVSVGLKQPLVNE